MGGESFQRFGPARGQTEAVLKAWRRDTAVRQQMTLERLLEERPAQGKFPLSTDDQHCWLRRAPCQPALLEQIRITDHAAAAMGPERAGSDQGGITPGQCFLKNSSVTGSTELSGTTAR